jgi:LuxR family maltose regulon positive regulatory protein
MAFARTKIQRPTPRRAHLERPVLERRLGEALLTRRLVLLHAAAGFGKTSALARACERLPVGTAVAWIACDADDSPLQLFECLVAAVEPYDPPWRTDPDALMRIAADALRGEPRRTVAAEVINALDACDVPHGVIVLDDLHRIEHPVVQAFLDELLERMTPRWTVAIATRREPSIALARLRVQREVAEFHLHELRFERDEARALALAEGLAPEEADRLYARTEGWPAGLRLALSARRGAVHLAASDTRAGAIDRHVFDFLADEVIDRLEPALRDFLLRTSVLPELTAARAAALSRDPLALQRLEAIEREGLFVSVVAGDEPTLRLHDLFREALEARFRRERPHEVEASMAAAAATEPDAIRRVGWWLRARRWSEAEAALAAAAEDLIASGFADELRALFERFPPEVQGRSARLRMTIAKTRWDWDRAVRATLEAAEEFAAGGDARDRLTALSYRVVALSGANLHDEARAAVAALLGEPGLEGDALARTLSAASWVEAARGDQRSLAPLWARLSDTLREGASLSRWNESAPLGPVVGLPGMRPELERYLAGACERLPDRPTPLRAKCLVMQGWLQLWVGDVSAARASVDAAADDARWLADPVDLDAPWRSLRHVLQAVQGRCDEALGGLEAIASQIAASGVRFRVEVYMSLYLFLGMRCAAMLERGDAVRVFAARLGQDAERRRDWLSPAHLASVPAHVAASEGRLDEACRAWERIVEDPWHGDIYGQVVESALRLADARLRLGASAREAGGALSAAFRRIDDSGEWGPVLFAGPRVLRRLADVRWGEALDPARQGTLRRWAERAQALASGTEVEDASSPGSRAAHAPEAGAALTGRELEVLGRLAAGDSNKLIARSLELSPHTVKRHVANILDKLALSSRGQAAAWYRELRR